MTVNTFKNIANSLPNSPGIYKYYDGNQLIYVGKAKNISKRVKSYFNKTLSSYKTAALVKHITKIDFTITATEQDALFLENSLIKEFQPKYNIDLKDDKTYPWIVIKNEPFPRIFLTRRKLKDQSEYIGPFTSVHHVRDLLKLIKYQIPHRSCKLNLSEKEIKKNKYKPCLEFHLGNCKAPCVGKQSAEDYHNDLMQIKNIIKGNLQPVLQYFKTLMAQYATTLEFEKAELVKKKIDYLNSYTAKSGVVNFKIKNADVFTIKKEDDVAVINYMIIDNSNIVNSHNQVVHLKLDETESEILQTAIPVLRENFNTTNEEVILEFPLEFENTGYTVCIPKGGEKLKLIQLSKKNSNYHLQELQKNKRLHLTTRVHSTDLLMELQMDLQLSETPYHIECFDNSNLQGTNAVSAMVCFKNAEPYKQEYRHFNVKTVTGINDFATMKEVVYRRYKRLLDENKPLPHLVIIDGGKGQLSAAYESIEALALQGKITMIGLAKNVEEIFFVGDQDPVKLPYNSDSLTLIRKIRDAVHQLGISHHRNKRSKAAFSSSLDDIKGIGSTSKELLLKKFKTINKIKETDFETLEKLIGKVKATILKNTFEKNSV